MSEECAGIIIQNDDGFEDVPSDAELVKWASTAIATAMRHDADGHELTIRMVGDDEMIELNREFRGKDYPTNVLSFPFEAPPGMNLPILGDIAVCVATLRREALEQEKPLAAHWAHIIVHGTLHLLGYDHIEEKDAELMEKLEIRALQQLGFADPYGDHS